MIEVAYTNHIGRSQHDKKSKGTNISTAADLAAAEKHNNHDYTQEDIDRIQSNINLELKEFNRHFDRNLQEVDHNDIVKSVKEIYHEEFDDAVEEYNNRHKRKNQKIADYYEKVSADKTTDLAVEGILQIGEMKNWKDKGIEERQKTLQIYLDVLGEMLHEIPGLRLAGADFHINESSPHLHWIAVCVDDQCINKEGKQKRGLSKRVGKSAVISKDVLGDVLQTKMRDLMEKKMQEVFPEWQFEDKRSGRNEDLDKNEYANLKLQQENKALKQENERLQMSIAIQSQFQEETAAATQDVIREHTVIVGDLDAAQKALEADIEDLNKDKASALESTAKAVESKLEAEKELARAKGELDHAEELKNNLSDQIKDEAVKLDQLRSEGKDAAEILEKANAGIDQIRRNIKYIQDRTDEIEKKPILLQNLPDEPLRFIAWCLDHLKGLQDLVYDLCAKEYQKYLALQKENQKKALDVVRNQVSSIDELIESGHARAHVTEQKNPDKHEITQKGR